LKAGKEGRKLTHSKRSHGSVLSVDLVHVGHTFGEHVWWDFISKLVSELGCLSLRPADSGSSIRYQSCHHTANLGRQWIDMSDGRRVQQFVLKREREGKVRPVTCAFFFSPCSLSLSCFHTHTHTYARARCFFKRKIYPDCLRELCAE